jgi:hypothetical protein
MPTIEEEFAAVLAAETPAEPAAAADKPTEGAQAAEAADGQAPAPSSDPQPDGTEQKEPAADGEAPATEGEKQEEAKPEEKPAEPALARRLAALAREDRRVKAQAKEVQQQTERLRPDLERLQRVRAAKTRTEAVKEMLGGDDEAMAELFLELNQHYQGGTAEQKDPEKVLDAKVNAKVKATLAEEKAAAARAAAEALEAGRTQYAKELREVLDGRADDFPLCSIAPPQTPDIAAIAETLIEETGKVPDPEEVLKLIEQEREGRLAKRQKKPETRTAPGKPGETSGEGNAKPIRRDDAPVTPPRRLSIEEEALQTLGRAS